MYGISSIRSYVVKRRPHLRHSRRRRMVSPLRPSRESITLSSTCAQNGHFTRQFLLGHPEARLPPRSWPFGAIRQVTSPREPTAALLPPCTWRRKSATTRWRRRRPALFL